MIRYKRKRGKSFVEDKLYTKKEVDKLIEDAVQRTIVVAWENVPNRPSEAFAHSLFTRESVGSPASSLTSSLVLSLSASRDSVGTTTEEEIKVRRRYFHRNHWDQAIFTFYCRAEENEADQMVATFRQQVILKVFSVNDDGSTNTELLSGSRVVPVQGTFTKRDVILDLSSLVGDEFYEIQIRLLAEVDVADQQGTNTSDCETFLREDFDIIIGI